MPERRETNVLEQVRESRRRDCIVVTRVTIRTESETQTLRRECSKPALLGLGDDAIGYEAVVGELDKHVQGV